MRREPVPSLTPWLGVLTSVVIAIATYSLQVELISGDQFVNILEAFTPVVLVMAGAERLQNLSTSANPDNKTPIPEKSDVQVEQPTQTHFGAHQPQPSTRKAVQPQPETVLPPDETA